MAGRGYNGTMSELVTVFKPYWQRVLVLGPAHVRPLACSAPAVAAALVAWTTNGSIAAHDWLPLAFVAALVLATLAAAGAATRPSAAALTGAGALVLLAGWTAASVAWSPTPAGARDEALLTGLYAIALLVPLFGLPRAGEQERALSLVMAALALLGAASAARLSVAHYPAALLFAGRLDFPVSYVNAAAALFALGFWPAVVLAARRSSPFALRAGALGSGSLFLALVVAAQSKGAVLGLVLSAALLFALAPDRLRLLPASLLAAAPAGAAVVPLTAPYRSASTAAAHHVGWTALAVLVAGGVLGLAYAAVDRRVTVGNELRRRIGRALLALLAVAVLSGGAAFFATVHSPEGFVTRRWDAFRQPQNGRIGSSHLASLGSNRYDFWRVALDEARTHPLLGIGGRGFYSAYLQHRRSPETPLRAHSLYLDTLAEEGVPGLLLLLVGVCAPLVVLARRLRRPAAVAAFGAGVCFFTHAAVDWIWTVPVVGVPALLLVGIGCAGDDGRPLRRWASTTVAVAAVAAAFFAFAPPWLAYRYVTAAYHSSDPAADLRRARSLDPYSLDPYFAAWRLARTPAARAAALEQAKRVEPQSVAVLYQLGLAYLREGRGPAALGALRSAERLDPHEPAIGAAIRRGAG